MQLGGQQGPGGAGRGSPSIQITSWPCPDQSDPQLLRAGGEGLWASHYPPRPPALRALSWAPVRGSESQPTLSAGCRPRPWPHCRGLLQPGQPAGTKRQSSLGELLTAEGGTVTDSRAPVGTWGAVCMARTACVQAADSSHTPHPHHPAHLAWSGDKDHSTSSLSRGPRGAVAPTSPPGQPALTSTSSGCPWTPPLSGPLVQACSRHPISPVATLLPEVLGPETRALFGLLSHLPDHVGSPSSSPTATSLLPISASGPAAETL